MNNTSTSTKRLFAALQRAGISTKVLCAELGLVRCTFSRALNQPKPKGKVSLFLISYRLADLVRGGKILIGDCPDLARPVVENILAGRGPNGGEQHAA